MSADILDIRSRRRVERPTSGNVPTLSESPELKRAIKQIRRIYHDHPGGFEVVARIVSDFCRQVDEREAR